MLQTSARQNNVSVDSLGWEYQVSVDEAMWREVMSKKGFSSFCCWITFDDSLIMSLVFNSKLHNHNLDNLEAS